VTVAVSILVPSTRSQPSNTCQGLTAAAAVLMPSSSVDGGSITGARRLLWRRHRFFQGPAAGRDGGHGGADAILVRGRRQHHLGATVAAVPPMPSCGGRCGADAVLASGWRKHHRGATVVAAAMRSCQHSFTPVTWHQHQLNCCTHTFDCHTLLGLSCFRLSSRSVVLVLLHGSQ
jgi:hypothetical protein